MNQSMKVSVEEKEEIKEFKLWEKDFNEEMSMGRSYERIYPCDLDLPYSDKYEKILQYATEIWDNSVMSN